MQKPILIALYPIDPAIHNFNRLNESFSIINYTLSTKERFIIDIQSYPYNSASAIFASYPGFSPIGGLKDSSIIDVLPKSLKIIGLSSAGVDGYDLKLLSNKNIKITNVPVNEAVGMDVADCALWHVLSGMRKFNNWDRFMHTSHHYDDQDHDQHTLKARDLVRNQFIQNESEKQTGFAFGHAFHGNNISRIAGKKCVVFGYGLIGKLVVKRLLTLGMDVHVLVRSPSNYVNDIQDGITLHSNESQQHIIQATSNSNVIVICLPGGEQTKHILNHSVLNSLANDSIIVNVGRGSCIDSQALKLAIESGKVSHVGLDVFPNEPIVEKYWLDEESINKTSNSYFTSSLTPHLGSSTIDTFLYATETNIENILQAILNGKYNNLIN